MVLHASTILAIVNDSGVSLVLYLSLYLYRTCNRYSVNELADCLNGPITIEEHQLENEIDVKRLREPLNFRSSTSNYK